MTGTWTQQSVLALAPDPESVKAGKGLASKAKWVTLACREVALWGECQGSGSKPYQTRIDLSEPAFKCSCPSRKFPCKHSLGLLLLYAEQRALFAEGEPPPWVSEWLESRAQRVLKQTEKQEKAAASPPPDPAAQAAQAKRQAGRTERVSAGLDDLERWMRDLVRGGLAAAAAHNYAFWDKPASRLVDAQAPGLARMVRDLAGVTSSGAGWPERLLARLGKLQLLVDAFRRRDALPEEVRADVLSLVGFPVAKEDVLRGAPAVRDRWMAIGQMVEDDPDGMRVQRLWLWGRETGRVALLLTFVHRSQRFESAVEAVAGNDLSADVAFYPGAVPVRALMAERRSGMETPAAWPECGGIEEALKRWRETVARKPWLEDLPVALREVTPVRRGGSGERGGSGGREGRWLVRDGEGRVLPLARRFTRGWELLAASGGRPVGLFGLWTGDELLPLSAWAEGRFVDLTPSREGA